MKNADVDVDVDARQRTSTAGAAGHAFGAIMGVAFVLTSLALQQPRAVESRETGDPSVERGRYLVHDVAMCIQCHTPRRGDGELDTIHLLEGAPIPVESPYADAEWAFQAPHIAGLPGWDPEQVVVLLVTGRRADGRAPSPPMPPFRFQERDARAIVAYLLSLD